MSNPIWVNTKGLPAIFDALNRDDTAGLENVLETSPESVNDRDTEGRTALHWAAALRRRLVPLLLSHGADALLQDDAGWSALHIASTVSGPEGVAVVRALLQALAGRRQLSAALLAETHTGATPVLLAASKGNLDTLKELLSSGVPVDLEKTDTYGNTALMRATSAGHLEAVQLLLELGARISNVNEKTGQNVLHVACSEARMPVLQLLVSYADEEAWQLLDRQQHRPRDLLPKSMQLELASLEGNLSMQKP
jgi:ankyrin repeat protein